MQGQASLSERANAQMASCVASNGQMYANMYPSCMLRNLQWHIVLTISCLIINLCTWDVSTRDIHVSTRHIHVSHPAYTCIHPAYTCIHPGYTVYLASFPGSFTLQEERAWECWGVQTDDFQCLKSGCSNQNDSHEHGGAVDIGTDEHTHL